MSPLYFVAGTFLLAVIGQTIAVGRIVWKAAAVVTAAQVTLVSVQESGKEDRVAIVEYGKILARVVQQLDGLERRVGHLEHPQHG